MKKINEDYPLTIKISFKKVFEKYELLANSKIKSTRDRAREVLDIAKKHPVLTEGLCTESELKKYSKQIDIILDDMFSPLLELNEIKTATIPFQELVFKSTQRYKNIIAAAGKDHRLELVNFDDSNSYIMSCSIILNMYYGFNADFRRPFHYNIPNSDGRIRNYKVLFNADFIEIEKTDKAKKITEKDYLELLENFDNIAIWKKKFPPGSYISRGFIVANMYDATTDVALSDFKASLLKEEVNKKTSIGQFERIIRAIFNLPQLKIGYTFFNEEDNIFEQGPSLLEVKSYILNGLEAELSTSALCERSYQVLFKKHEFYCIADVPYYHKLYPDNVLYKKLYDQNIKSAIIASLMSKGKVLGVLEIVSPNPKELNTVNANKLHDVMPYLVDSVERSITKEENEVELLIQDECTAIHPSVHWKFKKEAKRVLKSQAMGENNSFREIVFENVFPLYGQIDIKSSSEARNIATQKDLILQLRHVRKIITKILKLDTLPIYEQIIFRIDKFLDDLKDQLQVDSERHIIQFLRAEIIPLYTHLRSKSEGLKSLIDEYYDLVDNDKGFIYKHRKNYDDSVMLVNKRLAAILDRKQRDAQLMYPHYYERFKTDGVEHNLYIGESITKTKSYNSVYLHNLRLWQLQVMCEMENDFYRLKGSLPIQLNVASMILVFGSSLSLRFRLDEKRFDVDGTYNARYEVIKKRVDKANIKGTDERITQSGKIAIIYSQKEDGKEFLKYIEFLQSKKFLDETVEMLELEDLQGVTGLKALRVNVLYSKNKDNEKEYYTYEDLISQIKS
jgi:hypothetical protein